MGNGSFIPNSTQVHNVVLDVLLPFMREGERAVFLYIFRRTFGFNRHEDSIGLEQFEHGLITHEGKRLDYGCGMKRRVIIQALGFLMAAGIIERLEGGMGRTHISRYRMNVKESPLVQQLEEMQEHNATPEQISQILHPFRKVADSALNTKNKSVKSRRSNVEINIADSAPIINVADCAPNTPIKGAENDTERVQNSNPQSIRENKTTENKIEDTIPDPSPDDSTAGADDSPDPSGSPSKKKRIPESQQPGVLHEHTVEGILSMVIEEFHCLAAPNKLNEKFWDAEIKLIHRSQVIDFEGCLNSVDSYYAAHPKKCPINENSARARMKFGIDYAINQAKKSTPGRRTYGH